MRLRGSSPENMRLMLAHVPVSVAASDLGGIVPVAAEGRSWSFCLPVDGVVPCYDAGLVTAGAGGGGGRR
jgi:hypothetical protein